MKQNVVRVTLHAEAVTTASDGHGTALDLGPYVHAGKHELLVLLDAIVTSATSDATVDVKIQESSLGTTVSSDWTDISGAAFTQVVHGAVSSQALKCATNKRYIRDLAAIAGTTPVASVFVNAILTPRYDT